MCRKKKKRHTFRTGKKHLDGYARSCNITPPRLQVSITSITVIYLRKTYNSYL